MRNPQRSSTWVRPQLPEAGSANAAEPGASPTARSGPAENAVPAGDVRFRAILESHPTAVVLVDGSGRISWANELTSTLLGYSTSEMIGMPVDDLVPEASRAGHSSDRSSYMSIPKTRPMGLGRDLSIRRKDGRNVPVEIGLSSFEHDGGRFVVAVIFDITARKADEATLRSFTGNLQTLIAASPLATMTLDLDGRVLLWNPACERMFGWKAKEVVGQILPHVPPSELGEVRDILGRVAAGQTITGVELLRQRKDGGAVQAELYAAPQRDADGEVVAMIEQLADITGRRQLQESLLQTQKMESVGRLAGGIAHDFNNMLTAISGFAQLLLMDLPPDTRERENAESIIHAASQAAALTQQLLAFSRRQVMEPRILDPDRSIEEMESMLRRLIGEGIELGLNLGGNTGHVRADPAQLEQVILNLVVNACDAMPDGGRITIETGRATFNKEFASEHFAVSPGEYVMIAVSDTGVGMDKATRAHIFEPFFTTKSLGKGTGLGLATVYGIVQQNGGHIWLYSEPGEGTTFKVYLPLMDAGVSERADDLPGASGGTETILLVEDEPIVRDLTRAILQRKGYRLLVAATPLESLALLSNHPERIDMLVSDVIMPVLSGPELARQIREMRPDIRTLFLSGYTEQLVNADGRLSGMDGFLSKPFTADDLARKVGEILGGARTSSVRGGDA